MNKDNRPRITNPETGRKVLKNGAVGKRIRKSKTEKTPKPRKTMKKSSKKKGGKKKNDIAQARKAWFRSLKAGPTKFLSGRNCVQFHLCIETTDTLPPQGMLMNRFEAEGSKITSMSHTEIQFFSKRDDFVNLTKEQLSMPGFIGSSITFHNIWKNQKNKVVAETKHTFTNEKGYFTVKEMVKNIVEFEKLDRPKSLWFGGVDCHHIYFEGILKNKDGDTYCICWGS